MEEIIKIVSLVFSIGLYFYFTSKKKAKDVFSPQYEEEVVGYEEKLEEKENMDSESERFKEKTTNNKYVSAVNKNKTKQNTDKNLTQNDIHLVDGDELDKLIIYSELINKPKFKQ